eukprot:COSAG01_NODE_63183_length_281_cov_0.571429_1_plen_27_part_01
MVASNVRLAAHGGPAVTVLRAGTCQSK